MAQCFTPSSLPRHQPASDLAVVQTEDFSPSQIGAQSTGMSGLPDLGRDGRPCVTRPSILSDVRPDSGGDLVVDRWNGVDGHPWRRMIEIDARPSVLEISGDRFKWSR